MSRLNAPMALHCLIICYTIIYITYKCGDIVKLDRIEIFCAVARNMSFSKAAEECHVAQSAVSQQIRAMEEELGFALFERSTRRVSFTDAGQSFYVDCVKLMAGLDEALARAASKLNGKKSFLTVGIEGLMQSEVKADTLRRFSHAHPEVDIIPKQVDRDRKYEDLLNGKIDVVFDIPKYYTLNPHIKKCGVVRNEHCLMVCRDHPLAGREKVGKAELAQYTTFWGGIPKVEDYVTSMYLNYFRSAGIEPENVIYVPEQDVATFMVALNKGGNIVPWSERRQWSSELYSFVQLEEPLVFESAWLYSSENENPALLQFVNMIKQGEA